MGKRRRGEEGRRRAAFQLSSAFIPKMESFLEVHNVKKYFFDHRGLLEMVFGGMAPPVRAVDGVSFHIRRGNAWASWGRAGAGRRPSPV